jgi:hypothetical protein
MQKERKEIAIANEMSRQRAKEIRENNIARATRILNQKENSPTKS